jgi:hypothetical protein
MLFINLTLCFCLYHLKEDVYDKLERAGTFKKADNCTVFLGIHDAVLSAVESNATLLSQVWKLYSSLILKCVQPYASENLYIDCSIVLFG